MEPKTEANLVAKKKEAWQAGISVFILLLALTIGEYFIGSIAVTWGLLLLSITLIWGLLLLSIALLKAFFVVRDYMHLGRLFSGEEEESA